MIDERRPIATPRTLAVIPSPVARGVATIAALITLWRRNGICTISDRWDEKEASLDRPNDGSATLGTGSRHGTGGSSTLRGSGLRRAAVTAAELRPKPRGACRPGPEHPWASRSVAISQHVPPSRYPGSSPVIQPATAADLPNRQGPCLRNSSAHMGLARHNVYCHPSHSSQKKGTFAYIQALTARRPDGNEKAARRHREGGQSPPIPPRD